MRKKILMFLCLSVIPVTFTLGAEEMKNKSNAGSDTSAGTTIKLPQPKYAGSVSLEEAISKRRSVRNYENASLTIEEVSQLLWSAQGITDPVRKRRSVPSAGALYPLETYLVAGNINKIPGGIYRFNPYNNELIEIVKGDSRADVSKAALSQGSVKGAPATIIFAAVYERITTKYGDRGIKYAYIEAGHSAQNICLTAVSLNLGSVVIGAFYDEEIKSVLKMPDSETPLYIISIGKAAK
ncbi:MAG: nitroreductase A [Elusimicrobia bacterium ADurb.Bin231]|nr:MAG: nitroreductase A [Elusimicrobia bacterium ADurb.Bin231]